MKSVVIESLPSADRFSQRLIRRNHGSSLSREFATNTLPLVGHVTTTLSTAETAASKGVPT